VRAPALDLIWLCAAGLLAFTFVGYGLFLALLARVRPRPHLRGTPRCWPRLSILLVARAGEPRLPVRLAELSAAPYAGPTPELVLVRDGGTGPDAPPVPTGIASLRVVDLPAGSGKAAGLNAGLEAVTGEIVVFTDVRQEFEPGALGALAENFTDPSVGAVSGALEIRPSAAGPGAGIDAYWRMEKAIRLLESRTGSCVGCTGAIYAARRELLGPIPSDTWLDDVLIPMRIAQRGYRVLFDPQARAFDPQPLDPAQEQRRKPRTLGGNFQLLFRYPGWLVPGVGKIWLRYAAHKVLRLAGPVLLATLLAISLLRAPESPVHQVLLALQGGFYLLAALGGALRSRALPLRLASGFVFLNLMVVRGFFFWIANRGRTSWARPHPAPDAPLS